MEKSLVSTEWLAKEIKKANPKLKILYVSWQNGEDYKKCHIPQSLCFDGLKCRDTESPYMNMIPKPAKFARYYHFLCNKAIDLYVFQFCLEIRD